MARGPKPEPAEVKRAKGNPGRRRLPDATADATADLVSTAAPSELAKDAQAIWSRIAPELARLRFLRETDRGAFSRYCEHLAKWWELTKALRKEGETYLSTSDHNPDGLMRVNPKFLIRERIEKRLEVLEDRFGLSPAARQQILQRFAAGYAPPPPGGMFDQPPAVATPEAPPRPAASPVGLLARVSTTH